MNATLGVGSRALFALTLFFYVVSLALTTSRAYFGDTAPAPTPDEEATTRLTRRRRRPRPSPGRPRGTRGRKASKRLDDAESENEGRGSRDGGVRGFFSSGIRVERGIRIERRSRSREGRRGFGGRPREREREVARLARADSVLVLNLRVTRARILYHRRRRSRPAGVWKPVRRLPTRSRTREPRSRDGRPSRLREPDPFAASPRFTACTACTACCTACCTAHATGFSHCEAPVTVL